jgi:tRNA A-37 threonylcarbamoyl transferase component Bud32
MNTEELAMTAPRLCPACGNPVPAESAGGLCPACLMKAGLDSGPVSDAASPAGQAATQTSPAGSGRGFVPPSIDELADRFPQLEILELLGQGGMGAVYKARQRGLDRLVAVKILPPEISHDPAFAERFTREARALARLSHPNIVAVYDFGRTTPASSPSSLTPAPSPLYYIVMEFVDGVNLRQAIRAKTISPQQGLAVVPQICDALQFAHDEGVVHRDIKPENILVDKRGRVKIADFGLAKMLGGEPLDVALTGTHQVMGTLRYMAPEQLEGSHEVDHRADIYSLGVVFYELLTGELPLGRFAPPSKKVRIDVRLDEVVLRALEKEPALRYQQASQVKTELGAIVGSDAVLVSAISASVFGSEYRSERTLFGLPLVHVAFGVDPRTGKKRVAKGIIALGDTAQGVLAVGGAAYGVIAMGGMAVGLLSLGGLSAGLLAAIGGCAVGGFVWGGLAVGGVAIGGMAAGVYVFGGGGLGVHMLTPAVQDPEAEAFFLPWALEWTRWLTWLSVAFPIAWIATFMWIRRILTPPKSPPAGDHGPRFSRKAFWGAVWAPFALGAMIPLMLVETVVSTAGAEAPPPAGVPLPVQILAGLVTILGAAAPFGTTILGAIAVSEIRGSKERLTGLPLAVADTLLFPLLLLDSLVLGAVAAAVMSILGAFMPHGPTSSAAVHLPQALTLGIALPLIAWIDFRIARVVWRAAAGIRAEASTEAGTEASGARPQLVPVWTWIALGLALAMFLLVSAVSGWVDGLVWAPIVWLGAHGLGLVWDGDERLDRRTARGIVLSTWSVACTAVYFVLWLPIQDGPHLSQAAGAIGYFDRHYWPWHGEAQCSVSLKPAESTYRRLTIENRRTIDRAGIGIVNWEGVSPPSDRTRDEFELRLDMLDDQPAPTMFVDGRAGMTWRLLDTNGRETKGNHPFDDEATARWFRAAGLKAEDPPVQQQIAALTAVVREAVERDTSTGFAWSSLERMPVGYLEKIVLKQSDAWRVKHGVPERNTYPFAERLGSVESTYRRAWPLVPIGLAVMSGIWAAGAWLLASRYAPPGDPSSRTDPPSPPAARILIAAGGIQIVGSITTFLLAAGWIVDDYRFDAFFRSDAGRIPILIAQAVACLAGISAVVGGLAMRTGGGAWFSRTTAYGLLPPLTPSWLITCPLAVWGLNLTTVARNGTAPTTHGT